MRKNILLSVVLLVALTSNAQRGLRFGVVSGIVSTRLANAGDASADKKYQQQLFTTHFQKGIEFGYAWRYMGISTQIMGNTMGQKYNVAGGFAETKLKYVSPSLQVNFNSNPKNDVRFSGYIGGAYNVLHKYNEVQQGSNLYTGGYSTVLVSQKTATSTDTAVTSFALSEGFYKKNDMNVYIALGADFRLTKNILLCINGRFNYGLQGIENTNKIKVKETFDNTTIDTYLYPFYNRNAKYIPNADPTKTLTRSATTNVSYGLYVSFKYILASKDPLHYEMYGY